jgi:predicted nucleotidyltransferase
MPEAIILFGSFGKGEDNEESDIDISVIGGKNLRIDCKIYGKRLGRNINLVRLQNLRTASKEFRTALANGFVLKRYYEINRKVKRTKKRIFCSH